MKKKNMKNHSLHHRSIAHSLITTPQEEKTQREREK